MKKIIGLVLALALPTLVFAYFQPATLTNGVKKVAVYSEGQAKALFAKGYVLDTKKLGGFYSPDIIGLSEKTRVIAKTDIWATTTLSLIDSGTTFLISGSGTTITLPAVGTKGTKLRFIINGSVTDGNVAITSAAGDDIEGSVIVAGAVVDCNAADVLTFVADGENIGDYVELISTGTYWVPLSSGALTSSKLTCSG